MHARFSNVHAKIHVANFIFSLHLHLWNIIAARLLNFIYIFCDNHLEFEIFIVTTQSSCIHSGISKE